MVTDEQLRRMSRYKQPRSRSVSVGELVGGPLMERLQAQGALLRGVEAAFAEVADETFAEQCRVLSIDRGSVTVAVRDPSMVDILRRTHLFDLREHLARKMPELGPVEIRFRAADI